MAEAWKDIPGYEGMYQASTLGRVRGLDRVSSGKRIQGRVLAPRRTRGGYLFVSLYNNGKEKQYRINRAIAETFIPNPNGYLYVGHTNDIRTDNKVENLYWTTAKENLTHNGRHKKVGKKVSKAIVGTNGEFTVMFLSSVEAQEYGFNGSAIRNCLIGLAKSHKGYSWTYAHPRVK